MALIDKITAIADAIREKDSSTDKMTLADMPDKIRSISSGSDFDFAAFVESGSGADSIVSSASTSTKIRDYAFYYCTSLSSATFPVATSVGFQSFCYCSNMLTASLPMVTSVGAQSFFYCSKLASVDLPLASGIGNYTFKYCSSLTTVQFPSATSVGNQAFYSCSNLKMADFPVASSISAEAFRACSKLVALVLRKTDGVCTIATNSTDSSCPLDPSYTGELEGYIYVPSDLVDSYKSDSNWSKYADKIKSIDEFDETSIASISFDEVDTEAIEPGKETGNEIPEVVE